MERIVDVKLISIEYAKDSIGQDIEQETASDAICGELNSVTQQEWFMAARKGLNAEGMVKLRDLADYNKESVIEIDDVKYSIYRTFLTDDGGIELYYRKKAGDSL